MSNNDGNQQKATAEGQKLSGQPLFTRSLGWQKAKGLICSFLLFTVASFATQATAEVIAQAPRRDCPSPVLSRLKRHKVAPGETLESIAKQYNVIAATLMAFNPSVRGGQAPVGSELVIPPYNGIRVEVPAGKSFRDVATSYGVRADVVFEINGCQENPRVVFVPGVNWSPGRPTGEANPSLARYPLPAEGSIAFTYGWQVHPKTNQVAFHSGIDLLAPVGTAVISAGDGTVAHASERGTYGNLVVINHPGGQQTRYAHLEKINVQVGQQVRRGSQLGTVGTTGRPDVNEPHLHFEVRYNSALGWVSEDPGVYFQDMNIVRN